MATKRKATKAMRPAAAKKAAPTKGQVSRVAQLAREAEQLLAQPARLTPEERSSIAAAQRLLADAQLQAQLMERGLQSLVAAVRQKYGLPERFSFDPQTGEVTHG